MASRRNGTLYIRVTNHLPARALQHRAGGGSKFAARYGVKTLVWYEHYSDVNEAIAREKQLKKWERRWKLELIERFNPQWGDLYDSLNAKMPAEAVMPAQSGRPGVRGEGSQA